MCRVPYVFSYVPHQKNLFAIFIKMCYDVYKRFNTPLKSARVTAAESEYAAQPPPSGCTAEPFTASGNG